MTSINAAFDTRRNSLNAIRLLLALAVVVSHAWPLGGFGDDPLLGKTTVGHLAVFAFFAISGYLITASRFRLTTGRYYWHRFLRIFPALWVCLLLTAAVFAPVAYLVEFGTIRGFPTLNAAEYVAGNSLLRIVKDNIPGTLTDTPYGSPSWNGATWTLVFEFACYVIIGAAFVVRALTPRVVGAVYAVCALLLTVESFAPGIVPDFRTEILHVIKPGDVVRFLTVFTMFTAGALFYMWRDRIPFSPWWAAASLVVVVAALLTVEHPSGIIGLPLTYLCFWLAVTLPLHNLTGRADFSYGLYIYAYPVAQILAVAGVVYLGLLGYLLVTLVIAGALAVASWYLVEKRAMAYKDVVARRRPVRVERATDVELALPAKAPAD